jgi:hypothetical protein
MTGPELSIVFRLRRGVTDSENSREEGVEKPEGSEQMPPYQLLSASKIRQCGLELKKDSPAHAET